MASFWFFTKKSNTILKINAKFLEIEKLEYENWQSSNIENGVIKIKVRYQVERHQEFLDFSGLHNIDECKALIQICGTDPKCLYCKTFGHMRKACPNISKRCGKCKNVGHTDSQCNSALIVAAASNNELLRINDDFIPENFSSDQATLFESPAETLNDGVDWYNMDLTSSFNSIQKVADIQNKDNSKRNELTEEGVTSPNSIELQSEDKLAPTLDIKKEMMANVDKTINSVASDQSRCLLLQLLVLIHLARSKATIQM